MTKKTNPIQTVLQKSEQVKSSVIDTSSIEKEKYMTAKLKHSTEEKNRIAIYITENYIEDFYSVAIDAGSTQLKIIERMMQQKSYLSILTNNMTAFRDNLNISDNNLANEFIFTGGKYVQLFDALHGEETLNSFNVFNPNVVIIGVSGFVIDKGFLCHGNDEVKAKKLLFNKKFSKIIIPIDYSKFGKMDSYSFGTLDEFQSYDNNVKVIVACPPIKPVSEDKQKIDDYKKLKMKFDRQMDILSKKNVQVDVVPDGYLQYL